GRAGTGQGPARPTRALPRAGQDRPRRRLRLAEPLPPPLVPPLRRLRGLEHDLPPPARRSLRRRPRHARALPRLADAAPPAGDAPLVPSERLRPEPVRGGGPPRRRGHHGLVAGDVSPAEHEEGKR